MSYRFIDTHCHLDVVHRMNFDDLLTHEEILFIKKEVANIKLLGVSDFICVGTNVPVSRNAVTLAREIDGVWATVGLHPTDVHADWKKDIKIFKELLAHDNPKKIVGIGEIGIDLFRDSSLLLAQQDLLKAQIDLALENNLTIVFHIRDELGVDRSAEHVLRIIDTFGPEVKGVIHCFQQSLTMAKEFVARGLYLGIDAPIDYPKNEWLREVVRQIKLEHLVIETDAPFLPPQKLRGQKNTSAAVVYIAQQIALLKECSLEQVAEITTNNALKLFKIS